MNFASFDANCAFLSPPSDPLFLAILKLRVWVGDMDEFTFKLYTLAKMRSMAFYKRLKPALVEVIEKGIIGKLTPLSFWALCEAHGLSIRVVHGRMFYDCGKPTAMWHGGKMKRIWSVDRFELKPLKPLCSISYYSLADLRLMSDLLDIEVGTKSVMYLEIQKRIADAISN